MAPLPIVASSPHLAIAQASWPASRSLGTSPFRTSLAGSPADTRTQWFVTTAEMRASGSLGSLSVANMTLHSASTGSLRSDALTKMRRSELAGEIGWQARTPFRSQLASHARRPGEIGMSADHKSIRFAGLSGNVHFERKVDKLASRIPTVNSTGHGYHPSAPMYKHIQRKL